jgi:hypothetical protein
LKLNLAPHVPDDVADSVLQQFQPALERPGIRHNGMGGKEWCWRSMETPSRIMSNLISNVKFLH